MKREYLEKALEIDIKNDMLSYIDWHDTNSKSSLSGHEFDYEDLDEIVDKKNTYNEFMGIDKAETRESVIAEMEDMVKRYNESIKHEPGEFRNKYTKKVERWIYDE